MRNNNWLKEKRKNDNRVKFMVNNGLNHWAGTISPAPKSVERNEIESLEKALLYYKEYGVEEVVLQTKYMGSYCAIYLHRDINKTKYFSRNGYLINHLDRDKLISATTPLRNKLNYLFVENPEIDYFIIESELLPWRAMGDGLIEREYVNYYNLHNDLIEYRKSYPVDEKLLKISQTEDYKKFVSYYESENGISSKDNIFKPHIVRQYKAVYKLINEILSRGLENEINSLELYKKQLDFFGYKSEDYEFKAFNILKHVNFDGSQKFYKDNYWNFRIINEDNTVLLNLNDNFATVIYKAYSFFNKNNNDGLEGIMVKPRMNRLINIPHAFKVRNNNYLQLIYGVRFNQDYAYYMEKRIIHRKLKSAIMDSELNIILNSLQSDELNENNKMYVNTLYKVIDAENFNKGLDSRL